MRYNMQTTTPPPWTLKGEGYILVFRFPKDFIEKQGFIPDFLKDSFKGGSGCVMLLDCKESKLGPLKELLFMPGEFYYNDEKVYSITKIYTSSKKDAECSRENWGLMKELADFRIEKKDDNVERIIISRGKDSIMDITLKISRLSLPILATVLPPRFPVVQKCSKKLY